MGLRDLVQEEKPALGERFKQVGITTIGELGRTIEKIARPGEKEQKKLEKLLGKPRKIPFTKETEESKKRKEEFPVETAIGELLGLLPELLITRKATDPIRATKALKTLAKASGLGSKLNMAAIRASLGFAEGAGAEVLKGRPERAVETGKAFALFAPLQAIPSRGLRVLATSGVGGATGGPVGAVAGAIAGLLPRFDIAEGKTLRVPRGRPGQDVNASVVRNSTLNSVDQITEGKAFDFVLNNVPKRVQEYVDRFGATVNADNAKLLFEPLGFNGTNANIFHEPSSTYSKLVYNTLLKTQRGKGNNTVLFTAGGAGAGKTAALGKLLDNNALVFDSNLSGFSSAKKKINQALKEGFEVDLTYVHREPVDSFINPGGGVIQRALKTKRIVPIPEHLDRHIEAPKVFVQLAEEFGDRVKIGVINNTLGKGKQQPADIALLKNLRYNRSEIERRLQQHVTKEVEKGALGQEVGTALLGRSGQSSIGRTPGTTPQRTAPTQEVTPNKILESEAAGGISNSIVVPEGGKVRGLVRTIREKSDFDPEVKAGVKGVYEPITNKNTVRSAEALVEKDFDGAVRLVTSPESATAESNATAQVLIRRLTKEKKFEQAVDIAEITAEKATTQGQAIQALSMWAKLSPEGILAFAQRVINKANKQRGTVKIKLTPEVAEELTQMSEKAATLSGRDQAVVVAQMMDKIHALIPPTIGERLSSIQTVAQLLNPKTAIRNLGGNIGFQFLENAKDIVATAFDVVTGKVTGVRSKVLPSIKAQAKGMARGFKLGLEDAVLGIDTSKLGTRFDLPKTPAFRGKVGKAINTLLNIELRATDRAFYNAAYRESLLNQLRAARITDRQARITQSMRAVAHLDGVKRTFQDENVISKLFINFKKALNVGKDFGIGDIVIKYPKTPGNLIARGIDYSPFGFVNTVTELARAATGRTFNQRQFVESAARATTGSIGLVGTGAILNELGVLTGQESKDPDIRALKRVVGYNDYTLNVDGIKRLANSGFDAESAKPQEGDLLINYDWFQPASIPLAIGADMNAGRGTNKTLTGTLFDASESGIETLARQPLVQGLSRFFQRTGRTPLRGLIQAVADIPASFTPTLLNQIRHVTDNRSINNFDPDDTRFSFQRAQARIPGLSKLLPGKVNIFGEEAEIFQERSNSIFNVFFNPAFIKRYHASPEAQMVLDIFDATGETRQAPRLVQRNVTINGVKRELNAEEINGLQAYTGRLTRFIFNRAATNPSFMQLPEEEKAKQLATLLSAIGSAGKIVVLKNRPARVSSATKQMISLATTLGIQPVPVKKQPRLTGLRALVQ